MSAGSFASIARAAATASISDTGLAFTFQIASRLCDSASSALCSVTAGGNDSVSSGSTIAASAHVSFKCSEYFFCRPGAASQIVA